MVKEVNMNVCRHDIAPENTLKITVDRSCSVGANHQPHCDLATLAQQGTNWPAPKTSDCVTSGSQICLQKQIYCALDINQAWQQTTARCEGRVIGIIVPRRRLHMTFPYPFLPASSPSIVVANSMPYQGQERVSRQVHNKVEQGWNMIVFFCYCTKSISRRSSA